MRTILAVAALISTVIAAWADDNATYSFPVAVVTLQVGDRLKDEMIVERKLVANGIALRTHFTDREKVIGKVARRLIPAGTAIPLIALREPTVINQGERVSLEFRNGGLSIRSVGVALQAAVSGESVRVRNLDTGIIVNGIPGPDGVVAIGGD